MISNTSALFATIPTDGEVETQSTAERNVFEVSLKFFLSLPSHFQSYIFSCSNAFTGQCGSNGRSLSCEEEE